MNILHHISTSLKISWIRFLHDTSDHMFCLCFWAVATFTHIIYGWLIWVTCLISTKISEYIHPYETVISKLRMCLQYDRTYGSCIVYSDCTQTGSYLLMQAMWLLEFSGRNRTYIVEIPHACKTWTGIQTK